MELLKKLRQTGRTTRMLNMAHKLTALGTPVAIVVHDRKYAELVRRMVRNDKLVMVRVMPQDNGLGIDWDEDTCLVPGMGRMPMLADHAAIEYRYHGLLEHLHRWDAKPGEWGATSVQDQLVVALKEARKHIPAAHAPTLMLIDQALERAGAA